MAGPREGTRAYTRRAEGSCSRASLSRSSLPPQPQLKSTPVRPPKRSPSWTPLTPALPVSPIAVGATIPSGEFGYVPFSPELADPSVCGLPSKITTDSWKGKKVVLFGVPGAFTKTCSANHVPPYVEHFDELKSKGVDAVYCIASNDLFVQSAWGRVLHTEDKVVMLSDSSLKWLTEAGLTQDLSHVGFGTRSARFAAIIDDLKVTYIGIEDGPGVGPSGAEAVLAKL